MLCAPSRLISLAPSVPGFLARSARAAAPQKDGRVLIVIQLDGGNDGINTVVPFKDEGYARNRQALALPVKRLHLRHRGNWPSSRDARRWPDARGRAPRHCAWCRIPESRPLPLPKHGHLAYGRFDPPADYSGPGWIGRGLDARAVPGESGPASLYIGTGTVPSALRGTSAPVAALEHIDDLTLDQVNVKPAAGDMMDHRKSSDSLGSFVQRAPRSTPIRRPIAWQPWAAMTPALVILHRRWPNGLA